MIGLPILPFWLALAADNLSIAYEARPALVALTVGSMENDTAKWEWCVFAAQGSQLS
jgi:hypothetical protein